MSEEDKFLQTQHSPHISEATEAPAGGKGVAKDDKKRKHHVHYTKRKESNRMRLLKLPILAKRYADGTKKAGQRIKWQRTSRLRRYTRYAFGTGSVGTVVVPTRVARAFKRVQENVHDALAPFLPKGADSKMRISAESVAQTQRAIDIFLHDRYAQAQQVATNKFGESQRVTDYDAMRAWAIHTGGRHVNPGGPLEVPFISHRERKPKNK